MRELHAAARGDMRTVVKYLQMAFASALRETRETQTYVRVEQWHVLEWTSDLMSKEYDQASVGRGDQSPWATEFSKEQRVQL